MTTPDRIASQAGDLIREFIHGTISTCDGWRYPPQASSAIASLAYMAGMLPQAIEQTLRPVEHTHEQGRVLIDGGHDAEKAVAELRAAVADAVHHARLLSAALDRAHSAAFPMGLDIRGLPDFDD